MLCLGIIKRHERRMYHYWEGLPTRISLLRLWSMMAWLSAEKHAEGRIYGPGCCLIQLASSDDNVKAGARVHKAAT
jgi:hypothetical protein